MTAEAIRIARLLPQRLVVGSRAPNGVTLRQWAHTQRQRSAWRHLFDTERSGGIVSERSDAQHIRERSFSTIGIGSIRMLPLPQRRPCTPSLPCSPPPTGIKGCGLPPARSTMASGGALSFILHPEALVVGGVSLSMGPRASGSEELGS